MQGAGGTGDRAAGGTPGAEQTSPSAGSAAGESGDASLEVEGVIHALGKGYRLHAGPFQIKLLFYFGMCFWMALGFHLMGLVFLLDLDNPDSAAVHFHMTPVQVGMVGSATFLGWALGAPAWSWLADRHGRRRIMLVAILAGEMISLATMVMPTFSLYAFCYLLMGSCTGGAGAIVYVMLVELSPPAFRGPVTSILNFFWVLASVLIALIAWIVPQWQPLVAISSLPGLTGVFMSKWLPQSPRFLAIKRRNSEARLVLERIARTNDRAMPRGKLKVSSTSGPTGDPCDLFAPSLRTWTLALFFCWLAASAVYYGLSFQAGDMGGSIHVNSILLSLVEVPSYLAVMWACERFGRRKSMIFFFGEGGFFLLILFFGVEGAAKTGLAMLGKFGIAAAFVVVYIYAGELFPTSVRAVGLGACNIASRLGSIISPVVIKAVEPTTASLCFGIVGVTAAALTLLLPETKGRPTPDFVVRREPGVGSGAAAAGSGDIELLSSGTVQESDMQPIDVPDAEDGTDDAARL